MKIQIFKPIVAMAVSFIQTSLFADVSPTTPVINSITANNGQIVLNWSGGRPSYQVQSANSLSGNWFNVGTPTSAVQTIIPMTNSRTFFRVVSDFTAQYQVTFDATWSQTTHPTNWPANAHWSGLVGGTHNENVHFFRLGETSSEGIRRMAELGQQATLLTEVATAVTNGTAHLQLAGLGLSSTPGSRSLVFPQPMRRDFPLVTLTSMIAPSPDWFIGVDSLNLIENGQWVSNKVVTLYGNDAGTDSGASYGSPDLVTAPRGVATQFTGFPAIQNGVIVPFGTFTFTRLD